MRRSQYQLAVAFGAVALLAVVVGAGAVRGGRAPVTPDETKYAEMPSATSSVPAVVLPASAVRVSILAYHIVRPSYPSDSAGVRALALTPETFDAELAHLKDSGYHVVGFHDLEAYFASSTPLPPKPVILSFDDGWGDQFQYAFPVLEKYHDMATFFVFTNAIGRRGFLTWDDLRAMLAAGMTVGDHSRSHPYLAHITATTTLWAEIDGSKRLLERELGVPVTEFAYPFGQYDAAIVSLVRKAGFRSARGDYWHGAAITEGQQFALPALNAPTTTAAFIRVFP